MKTRFALSLAALVIAATSPLRAETAEQWIAKARAYVGTEEALNAVTAVRITGTIHLVEKTPSPEDKAKLVDRPISLPVEIMFQKPFQQRITITRPEVIITDGLDGYDAWQKRTDPKNPTQWRLSLQDANGIKSLRANTWENLYFYRGLEKKGGRVQVDGDEAVDGVACVKVSFYHSDSIVFRRFFEKATGRLVKTVTENGTEIREQGSITVKGVRYPRKVVNKSPTGEITTIDFEKVVLNEPVPVIDFAVPGLQAN
jgi:hypothetical protein